MKRATGIKKLLKNTHPKLNSGDYVFCTIPDLAIINPKDTILVFKEEEGNTIIIKKELADNLKLEYSFIASWITLTVHSSLESIGLTAAFSRVLSEEGISCNVVAACYHDHIFVNKKEKEKALKILTRFSDG